jgi:hypothetical protein
MAALGRLQQLFKGDEVPKNVLRKCLALARKAEELTSKP